MTTDRRCRICFWLCVVICLACLTESDAFFKGRKKNVQAKMERSAAIKQEVKNELGLVGEAGHYLWTYLSSRWLYIWVTTGYSFDEKLTIYCVSILCNVLYCLTMLIGFIFLPRDLMLLIGLFTATIGPSLVLFILGTIGISILFMAFYPMYTVAIIWSFNFIRSHFMQRLALMLKLDVDGDGTVNWSDAIAWAGKTKWGSRLGMNWLHDQLYRLRTQNFLELISERIEKQEEKIIKHIERIISSRSADSSASQHTSDRTAASKGPKSAPSQGAPESPRSDHACYLGTQLRRIGSIGAATPPPMEHPSADAIYDAAAAAARAPPPARSRPRRRRATLPAIAAPEASSTGEVSALPPSGLPAQPAEAWGRVRPVGDPELPTKPASAGLPVNAPLPRGAGNAGGMLGGPNGRAARQARPAAAGGRGAPVAAGAPPDPGRAGPPGPAGTREESGRAAAAAGRAHTEGRLADG